MERLVNITFTIELIFEGGKRRSRLSRYNDNDALTAFKAFDDIELQYPHTDIVLRAGARSSSIEWPDVTLCWNPLGGTKPNMLGAAGYGAHGARILQHQILSSHSLPIAISGKNQFSQNSLTI
jgi:hypothetical protein